MFDENFNAEKSIKAIASAIRVNSLILLVLSGFLAFILICIDADEFWWISLIIFGGSCLIAITVRIYSILLWAYGDITGNIKKIANSSSDSSLSDDSDSFPEI